MYDVAIIGAGITGTSIARELSKYQLRILLLDKNNDVAGEATMANSGIIHNGHTARQGKLKGKLTLQGSRMFEDLCRELEVPFKKTDMLIVGFDEEDEKAIYELYDRAAANCIDGIRIIGREEALRIEPVLDEHVRCAMLNPGCGLIDPWELCIALAENAVCNGVELRLNAEVNDLTQTNGFFEIKTSRENYQADIVINCAGMYADKINGMTGSAPYTIEPKRGQYVVLDRSPDYKINHIISHCKTDKEKGVFLIPTISGNLMIGPDMEGVDDREGKETTASRMDHLKQSALKLSSSIPMHRTIRSFSGLKAKCSIGDFFIEESKEVEGFINVAGINNPGLTSSPAIASHVAGIVGSIFTRTGNRLSTNHDFTATRSKIITFKEVPDADKTDWIRRNPAYGRIVCRCEQVSEGEINDAIHRNPGATSVKGVKKRTRASMGRCQGSYCGLRIVGLLASELNLSMDQVLYENVGSNLLPDSMP
ncbi:NAD(P)/FAD-dependent oxidoreductase [Paenibacillus sp. SI8]|uniref:NAD(P)/FAD-dependent oxidoreductase n=1 Tax=unclassified Paenibacillus TaxID=185978 RepID=UPI003465341D